MKQDLFVVAATLGPILFIVGIAAVIFAFVPTREDRFTNCMAIAERAGLLDDRRDDAALVCLEGAMQSRDGGSDGPSVGVTSGGQTVIIP